MDGNKLISGDLIIGVSINNVTGITGKAYDLADLVRAAVEAVRPPSQSL
jgi:hypothetical protein